MSEVRVDSGTTGTVLSALTAGRDRVESLSATLPASVEAGDLSPTILSMVARLVDNAAVVSESLHVLTSEVRGALADLHRTDALEQMRYVRGLVGSP